MTQENMGETPPQYTKVILKLATPVLIAMLAQAFINQVDSIMIGHLAPEVATPGQAAVGISLKLLWIIGGFLSAIGIGTLAMVSRRYGEKDHTGVSKTVTNALVIATIASLILSFIAIILANPFIQMITENQQVIHYGAPYLQIRLTGVLSMVLTAVYKSYFDGLKMTHVHMVASIVMNIFNLFVNWLLIFGRWGFPEMGVNGAALASALCTYIGLAIMIGFSLRQKYRARFQIYQPKRVNKKTSFQVVKLSLPAGIATVVLMTGFLLFDKIVATITPDVGEILYQNFGGFLMGGSGLVGGLMSDGVTALVTPYHLNVSQLIMNFSLVLAMIGLSFGTVTATLVGNSLGEKRPEWAEKYGWTSVKIGMAFMSILGIIVLISPETVISVYNTDPNIIEIGKTPFRIIGVVIPLIAMGLILSQAHFGAGNTRFVMLVEVGLHFGFLVPVSALFVLYFGLGLNGAWIVAASYIVLLSTIMAVTFYRGKWKNISV